jgi:adenylate cyclase
MRSFLVKFSVAFFLATLLSWAYLYMPQAFFSLDSRLRDFMFVMRGELPKKDRVTIVDIDEKSLKEYGQWPWSRDVIAELLYKLRDANVGIVGLDIVFAEEDRTSPSRYIKKYPKLTQKLQNYDEILAECLMQTPVIGGYIFTFEKTQQEDTPSVPAVFIEKNMKDGNLLTPKGVVLNIPMIQEAFYSSGFFNNTPDEGGMIRSVPLIMKYDGVVYPSLVMEMIRVYSGVNKVDIIGDSAGVREINFGEFSIPTDKVGRLHVNFRGASKHFKYVSAADILNNDFDKKDIDSKFVLVGTSAVGLFDLRSIPFDSTIAGVEVHANALDNILEGDYLEQPSDMVIYDLMIIWIIVYLFLMLFSYIRSWFIIPIAVVSFYLLFRLFFYLMFDYGMVLNLLFPFVAYSLTLVISVGIDYIIASRQKEQAKRMLGKKVSPAVMEYLLKHSDDDLVASKEVEATIFFSDIRSFTTISEKIGSPDKLIHMLNDYMTPMVDTIIKYQGTIDKFIGDAIMAYWNAPVKVQNHADMALSSAVQQIEMLKIINKDINIKYDVNIAIGIGIHTGIVTAGDMGSEGRSDYTIIGDNVNLASRLEGLTKQYGAQILISEATRKQLKDSYKIRPIDLVEVKGKNEAVEIHEVICSNKTIYEDEINLYKKATKLFREANIKDAYKIYTELQEKNPSILYQFYKQRCEKFMYNPELEFTPILKMTTK